MAIDQDDVSNEYMLRRSRQTERSGAVDMENWLKTYQPDPNGPQAVTFPVQDAGKPEETARDIPEKPLRKKSDDTLGRPETEETSAVGTGLRNVSEIPRQVAGGIDDAARHLQPFMGPLNDAADWFNNNVIDTTYSPVSAAKTPTGEVTRKLSEFFAGFIPAGRALKAIGMGNAAVRGVTAGAVADFLVRDPHEGRLADLWNELKLPPNVLTDYLKSKDGDTDMEARFKNSLEGAGLGTAMEGVIKIARVLRAARSVPGVKEAETDILRSKYGELTDEEIARVSGNAKEPVVSAKAPSRKSHFEVYETDSEGNETLVGAFGSRREAQAAHDARVSAHKDEARIGGEGEEIEPTVKSAKGKTTIKSGHDDGGTSSVHIKEIKPKGSEAGVPPMDGLPQLEPRGVIRSRGSALPDDFEVYVNFANIDAPEKVKFAIGKVAEAMKSHIDEARRGSITQSETQAMADDLGMSVPELLARRKGEAFNAEEAVAARGLWAASGEKLVELAKRAMAPNAGALDQFAFRRQMAVHSAIQAEVLGARAEAARGLASWRIPVGGDIEKARAIEQIMSMGGGTETSKEMAKRLAFLAEAGANPAAIAKFADRGAAATTMDAVKEVWVNGLLTAPKTHAVNVLSNTLVAFSQIYERAAAGAIRSAVGGEGVEMGESVAMAFGMVEGMKDAFRLSAKALMTGESAFNFGKVDLARSNAVSSEAFRMSKETGMGRAVDFIGSAVNVPQRLLGAEDEFFKTIGYRMELNAQALRAAKQEGLSGQALADRIAELKMNPPESLRINAADAALYSTFTNETGAFGKAIMNLRNIDSPWNPLMFVLPFVRTPVNIARYAFERSPFAPLVSQWRADISAGGARADLALAKMSTGTGIMMVALDFADSGLCSGEGPRDKDQPRREALMREGWKPYSCKIGDRWYSYNRADPFGMTMGFAASIAESVKKGELNQDDVDEWQEVVAMSIAAVAQVTISKTYLEGFSKFVEVMTHPQQYTQKYVDDLFASFLPATSLNNTIKNVVDPVQREVNSPMDAVKARIAGLSQNLPPRRDLWGRELDMSSGLGKFHDALSPVDSKREDVQPIDREIMRQGSGPQRIDKRTNFDGVMANLRFHPQVYDDYVRLSGNDLKPVQYGGMGAMDYLNAVVTGKHPMSAVYKLMTDESQKAFVQQTIGDYRKLAQQQILANPKHAGFKAELEQLKAQQFNQRLPYLQGN